MRRITNYSRRLRNLPTMRSVGFPGDETRIVLPGRRPSLYFGRPVTITRYTILIPPYKTHSPNMTVFPIKIRLAYTRHATTPSFSPERSNQFPRSSRGRRRRSSRPSSHFSPRDFFCSVYHWWITDHTGRSIIGTHTRVEHKPYTSSYGVPSGANIRPRSTPDAGHGRTANYIIMCIYDIKLNDTRCSKCKKFLKVYVFSTVVLCIWIRYIVFKK